MSPMIFDERLAGQLESIYQARDMVRRRQLARDALGAAPGERIIDVGCGPGFYAAELLEQVGADGVVVGVDSSPAMLPVAAGRCLGHRNAGFLAADVTSLPLKESGLDAALCVQVLEYVPDVTAGHWDFDRAYIAADLAACALGMNRGDRPLRELLRAWIAGDADRATLAPDLAVLVDRYAPLAALVLDFHDALDQGPKTHPWPAAEVAQLLAP
jgi:SAM-dependent methyltransferase